MESQKKPNTHWQIIETDLTEIGNADLKSFTARFRSDEPTLLIYRLKQLPWTGVAQCAPLNHMLWATEGMTSQLYSSFSWSNKLNNDKAVYDAFCRELKMAGISRKAVPGDLFRYYTYYDSYLGKSSLGFKLFGMGQFRIAGYLLPNEYAGKLISYYEKQLQEFDNFAFLPAVEGLEFDEPHDIEAGKKGILSAKLWHHPLRSDYSNEMERLVELEIRSDLISEMIQKLESGRKVDLPLHYHDAIRPATWFALGRSKKILWEGNHYWLRAEEFPDTALDVNLYGLRAKLIRILAWPSFYFSVESRLENWSLLSGIKHELDDGLSNPDYCVDEINKLRETLNNKQAITYNFIDEIYAFKKEMEARYPVLTDNPLSGLI